MNRNCLDVMVKIKSAKMDIRLSSKYTCKFSGGWLYPFCLDTKMAFVHYPLRLFTGLPCFNPRGPFIMVRVVAPFCPLFFEVSGFAMLLSDQNSRSSPCHLLVSLADPMKLSGWA